MKIVPIILSGGSGTRLWPLSRKQYPKQYLPLLGKNTMLQETILRLNGLENVAEPIVVCNVEHRFLVAEQLIQININNPTIILEPIGKNTAPAISAAVLYLQKQKTEATFLVLSADHLIQDVTKFHQAINLAIENANKDLLVTFGIVPNNPNTGYGYIKAKNKTEVSKVEKFVEKPDFATAKKYLQQGNYLWNSGMFMFKSKILLDELTKFSPKIINFVNNAVDKAQIDLDFIRLNEQSFSQSPSDSIDYALMEKSDKVVVVPLDAGWNDIGSWQALYQVGKKDKNKNAITGDVICDDVTNSYINADNHMVAAIGVKDLIIVDTPDATLVAHQDKAQDVKKIVEKLQTQKRGEPQNHRKVYRPWGWYDSIDQAEGFQVKKINVKPKAKLSLQKHQHRSEHWIVINGKATITRDGEKIILEKNQSTYIAIGMMHSLANETDEPLEIIEVQCGSYLGEDDIERLEDVYGRVLNCQ